MRLLFALALFAALAGCAKSSGPEFEDALAGGADDPDASGPRASFHELVYEDTVSWYEENPAAAALRAYWLPLVASGAFCFASDGPYPYNRQLPTSTMVAPNGTNQISVFLDWDDEDYLEDHLHLAWHVAGAGWQLSPRLHRGETTEFSIARLASDINGTLTIDEAWMCLADGSHDFVVDRVEQGDTPPWFLGSFDIKLWFDAV